MNKPSEQLEKLLPSLAPLNTPTDLMINALCHMEKAFLGFFEVQDCVLSVPDNDRIIQVDFTAENERHCMQIRNNPLKSDENSVEFSLDGQFYNISDC